MSRASGWLLPGTAVHYRPRRFGGPVRTGAVLEHTRAGVLIAGRIPGRPWRDVRALVPIERVATRPAEGWSR